MKTILLLLVALSPAFVAAQTDKETVAREVEQYAATVHKAADTFLNRKLPDAERIKAIQPYDVIYDAKQSEQFKDTVLDEQQSPEIRAAALRRVVAQISSDRRLISAITQWLGEPRSPRPLREAALAVEQNQSFMNMNSPDVYQKMLDDPEPVMRVFAFTRLVANGDARAQQRLIRGIESPDSAPLPVIHSISILTMAPKPEFYPAVYKLLGQTKDPGIRLEAIRVLGPYPEARQTLIGIANGADERPEFREAALGALYSGDRENIASYVAPILREPSAPPRLKAIGIRMTTDVRQANAFRAKAVRADDYDRLVRKVAQETSDEELRAVAGTYISTVKPRF